jgi:16S rRNA (cytosine1402-N4)-methyltransferase
MTNKEQYHIPVMLNPCLDGLNIHPDGVYIDVTFGGGGHSRAIFEKLSEKGRLIAFDQDPDAAKNTWEAPNFTFIASNFEFLKNHIRMLRHNGQPVLGQVDGILGDLGVSSHQFDAGNRGFSIRTDDPLDMRMNQAGDLSAKLVVNTYSEDELTHIFRKYGELNTPGKIAGTICRSRTSKSIETTGQLMDVLSAIAPKFKEHKFFAQVFQAIRIEVNQEMQVLEKFLVQTPEVLKPGGRLVIMSYHSLEDRLVKNFMKRGNLDGSIEKDFFGNVLKPLTEITRKPIVPTEDEIEVNTRARSAKLRIAEKNNE